MSNVLIRSLVGILLTTASLSADPPRTELKEPPLIAGRTIRRLVLLEPLRINHTKLTASVDLWFPAGNLVPVSEDEGGIFFQAEKEIFSHQSGQVNGGVYVLKSTAIRMHAYTGDARVGARTGVDKDRWFLSADLMENFHPH